MTAPEVWAQHDARHSETRGPARVAVTAQAPGTSHDPAQQARRALLWYLATGTPAPHPGMPNVADIPDVDLWVILHGLVDDPAEDRWDSIESAAFLLKACMQSGDHTDLRWYEEGLVDAINSAAPDRQEQP